MADARRSSAHRHRARHRRRRRAARTSSASTWPAGAWTICCRASQTTPAVLLAARAAAGGLDGSAVPLDQAAAHRRSDLPGPRARARARRGAPRPQAGQRLAGAPTAPPSSATSAWRSSLAAVAADAARHDGRHRGVHGARTGALRRDDGALRSLCARCVLYEMLTGRPPFLGDDAVAVISQHINTAPVAPSWHNRAMPRALEALILQLLAKNPAQRPASAAAVRDGYVAPASGAAPPAPTFVERPGQAPQQPAPNPLDRLASGIFVGRETETHRLRPPSTTRSPVAAAFCWSSASPGSARRAPRRSWPPTRRCAARRCCGAVATKATAHPPTGRG